MKMIGLLFSLSCLMAGDVLFADVIMRAPEEKHHHPAVASSSETASAVLMSTSAPIALPAVVNNSFCAGEKLTFLIKYEFVNAGTATMEVLDGPLIADRPTFQIQSRAESSGFVDTFFKVRDFNASTIDRESLRSINFHQNLKEGKYKVIRNTAIDYKTGVYRFSRIRKGTKTDRPGQLHGPVFDIFSAFFYTRTLPLKLGETYEMTVLSDEEIYQLAVYVAPKLQKINVPAGKFECLRVDPKILGDGIFKAKEGKMSIWLTNDDKKIPVLIRSRVFIGAFDAELSNYTECVK